MVAIVKHDLDFILRQIKIAEAHSLGTPLAQIRIDANGNVTTNPNAALAVPTTLSPYGLRTVDGSYNNLMAGRDQWGAADNPFSRLTNLVYRNESDDSISFGPGAPLTDGNYGVMGDPPAATRGLGGGTVVDADPRIISNLIVDQTLDNPAAIYAALLHSGVSGAALATGMTEIRAAKVALDTAIAAAGTATASIAVAEQALTNAETAAISAQSALTAAMADAVLKQVADTAADQAVTNAQLAVVAANAVLDDVTPSTPEEAAAAAAALAAAQADLTAKQGLATVAQAALTTANANVVTLQTAANGAATAVAAASQANTEAELALAVAAANAVVKSNEASAADTAVSMAEGVVDAAETVLAGTAPGSQAEINAAAQLSLAQDALAARIAEAALTQTARDNANDTVSNLTTAAEGTADALADAIQFDTVAQSALTAAMADAVLKQVADTAADQAVTNAQLAVVAANAALGDGNSGTPEEIAAANVVLAAA